MKIGENKNYHFIFTSKLMGKMNGQCTVLDLKSLMVGGQLAQILGRYVPVLNQKVDP